MPDDTAQRAALDALTLLALPRVGLREWHRRVRTFGSATAALEEYGNASPALHQARADAIAVLDATATIGGECLAVGSARYPGALLPLTDADSDVLSPAPPILFVRGDPALLQRPAVAIVGTRHATATGLRVAERLARECAEAGVTVISGLARGIDAAAHTGALDAGSGATIAVVATGLDVTYPAAHRALQARIATEGLVVSELAPGQRPTRGSFPERNRLIAALGAVTLVVEAGHKSGALLTAHMAHDLGRMLAAVPGAFDSAASQGSNALLRDGGAQFIACTDDLLTLLGASRPDRDHVVTPAALSAAERAVWDQLSREPLDIDLVLERSGWAADACLAAVTTLELKGLVRATGAGALSRT